jgi:hypothetical protein
VRELGLGVPRVKEEAEAKDKGEKGSLWGAGGRMAEIAIFRALLGPGPSGVRKYACGRRTSHCIEISRFASI